MAFLKLFLPMGKNEMSVWAKKNVSAPPPSTNRRGGASVGKTQKRWLLKMGRENDDDENGKSMRRRRVMAHHGNCLHPALFLSTRPPASIQPRQQKRHEWDRTRKLNPVFREFVNSANAATFVVIAAPDWKSAILWRKRQLWVEDVKSAGAGLECHNIRMETCAMLTILWLWLFLICFSFYSILQKIWCIHGYRWRIETVYVGAQQTFLEGPKITKICMD